MKEPEVVAIVLSEEIANAYWKWWAKQRVLPIAVGVMLGAAVSPFLLQFIVRMLA